LCLLFLFLCCGCVLLDDDDNDDVEDAIFDAVFDVVVAGIGLRVTSKGRPYVRRRRVVNPFVLILIGWN